MFSYTKREVNLLVLLLTLLIFLICNLVIFPIINNDYSQIISISSNKIYSKVIPISQASFENIMYPQSINNISNYQINNISQSSILENTVNNTNVQNTEQQENNKTNNKEQIQKNEIQQENNQQTQRDIIQENKEKTWRIQIPKISLDVHIMEGTSSDILLKAVGHFEQTSKWNGNVGLAAHNRGYQCNFFQKIKNLKVGDEIIYTTTNGKKIYKVQTNKVILDTDWSYLEETTDNRITLITCEENRNGYRRCIQAIEIANYKR